LTTEIWGLERRLKNGSFLHGAQDLMRWSVGNARVERRGSNDTISKEVSGKSKIDPVIATLNAFTLMSRGPEAANTTGTIDEWLGSLAEKEVA
jgi:phage terminase large subunit-like protein